MKNYHDRFHVRSKTVREELAFIWKDYIDKVRLRGKYGTRVLGRE